MAIDDCKLTLEEKEARKAIYYKYIDNDNSFWNNLSRKFEQHCERTCKKQVTKPFIDIVKCWLFNCPHEYKVKRDTIYFGDFDKDGWSYYYNWVKRQFGSITRQLLDDKEKEERIQKNKEEARKKQIKKCKEWGLDYNKIGTIYQNKELEDVKIRWEGIELKSRKFPIKFFDMKEEKHKIMTLRYFKSNYYGGV